MITSQNISLYYNLKKICLNSKRSFLPAVIASFAFANTATAEINLIFGTYAADKPTQTVRQFKPFLDYLSQEMELLLNEPVKIKMQVAREYEMGIDDLVQGRVDFSRFGPASYVTAKTQNPDIQILAMESQKGKKTFKGVIAVHNDSKIETLADLTGGSFAFGDSLSTIGRFLAQSELIDAGIYEKDLSSHAFLGRHDRVGTAVGNKDFDAGALKSSTFNLLVKNNVPIRKLIDFDNVTKPWIAKSGLDPKISNAITTVFLNSENAPEIKSIAKNGFLAGADADYEPIRSAMEKSTKFGGS